MVGRGALQAVRALLLVGMVASLPMTSGWITVYVLGGVVLLFGLGACCCNCCCTAPLCDCDCDCPGCEPCGDGCCEDCDCDGDCCGGAGSGAGGGGGGSGGGGGCACVEAMPSDVAPALAAVPLLVPLTRRLPTHWLSHHPATPEYDQDTYPVASHRLCIGCFTTYPLFLAASAWLALAPPDGAWWAWLAGGTLLASLQALSAAGLARLRWQKAVVKAGLGLGLAAAVHGALVAPWTPVAQQGILLGLLVLLGASAVPRSLRMRGR